MTVNASRLFCLLVCLSTLTLSGVVRAQTCVGPWDPVASWVPRLPYVAQALEQDAPGVTNASYGYTHPPRFRGEGRLAGVYSQLRSGTLTDSTGSYAFKKDLGFPEKMGQIETMARTQFGRYSLRYNYTYYLRSYQGSWATFQPSEFRVGADMDLIQTNSFRLGLNADINWKGSRLTYTVPNSASVDITFQRPATYGVHVVYNPIAPATVSTSLELRGRFPWTDSARLTEYEIAGGLRFPRTIMGSSTVRGGYRYTHVDLKRSDTRVEADWSAIFGELVYYY